MSRAMYDTSNKHDTVIPFNIDNRPVAYEALFAGQLPYEPQPAEEDIGLAGLWRVYTSKAGSAGKELGTYLDQLPDRITKILAAHERQSRLNEPDKSNEPDKPVAFFSLINPEESLPVITTLTTEIFKCWEKSAYRNGYRPLLPDEFEVPTANNKQGREERLAHLLAGQELIVETASAVIEVYMSLGTKKPIQEMSNQDKRLITKLLANWGPQMATEWLNGGILERWLAGQNYDVSERAQWHEVFTPSVRKRFAVYNITDPLAALERVKTNLQEVLTDDNIANRLNWRPDEVAEVFTPSMRKRFAVHNITDPLAALERVKTNLQEVLTDDNIANRLNWRPDEVAEVFTPSMRKRFAVHNITDPLAGIVDW